MSDQKVRYYVKKAVVMRKQCSICGGTGKRERKLSSGQWKTESCCHCTNGITKIEHMTEIDLLDALKELGLIEQK